MKRLFLVVLAAIVAAGISGCSKAGNGGGVGDTLSVAIPVNVTQLNPILSTDAITNAIDSLMFDQLVTLDTHGNDVPDLASVVPTLANGGISKDGLTLTYHLRKNAVWSDGVPITSADVRFTVDAIMNPKNNVVSRNGYNDIASMDTPDKWTIVFHMKHIYPPAIDTLFGESDSPYRILPAHILAKYPSLNDVPFNADPVTSGPYSFARWSRGNDIVLDANPRYFRGAPQIKRLDLKFILDGNTIAAEMRTHEVQLAIEIVLSTYNDLKDAPGVVRQLVPAPSYESILFNVSRAPLNDVRVRRAISLAVNRAALVRDGTYGTGTVASGDLSPFSWAFDPSIKPIPYDPAAARALLDAAGWKVGPGGIRVKNGKRLSLQFTFGQGSTHAQSEAEEIQAMLRAVGIGIQLKSYVYQLLFAAYADGGIYATGKYDMALYAWGSGTDPDNSSQWLCSMIPPAGNNYDRYCSPAMDAAQHLALSTFDRTKRKAAYATIERLLVRDVPMLTLFYQKMRYAHIPQLQNFTPNGISEGWNAAQWSLK